jgi:hypothetical protein
MTSRSGPPSWLANDNRIQPTGAAGAGALTAPEATRRG